MNKVAKILVERDDMTEDEAREVIEDCRSECEEAIADGDYDLVEDILASDLGLEPDYIFDVMGW